MSLGQTGLTAERKESVGTAPGRAGPLPRGRCVFLSGRSPSVPAPAGLRPNIHTQSSGPQGLPGGAAGRRTAAWLGPDPKAERGLTSEAQLGGPARPSPTHAEH